MKKSFYFNFFKEYIYYIHVVQVAPFQPDTQEHVFGPVHVPPFEQVGEQVSMKDIDISNKLN